MLAREVPGLGRQGPLTEGRIQSLGKTTVYPVTQDGPNFKFAQRKFLLVRQKQQLPCTQ